MNSQKHLFIVLLLLALFVPPQPAGGAVDSFQTRYLDGLRQRGLFLSAEAYCRTRLQWPDLTPTARADLVIELSRTLAEHAMNMPPADRAARWQAARAAIEDFLARNPDHPRGVLVQFQGALVLLAQGELARQESELTVRPEPLREEALARLREATKLLDALYLEVEGLLQDRATTSAAGATEELTTDELLSLQRNIQYQHARALRNQGLCYGVESADRANSLTKAIGVLGAIFLTDKGDPITWNRRLDEVTCHRLLMDFETAERLLDTLGDEDLPVDVQLRVRAERLHLALAMEDFGAVSAILSEGRTIDSRTEPELDFARLQAMLAIWNAATQRGEEAAARRWQELANEQLEQIELDHGPYWARRGEMLLAGSVEGSAGGEDVALRVRVAENAYRSGRLDEAIAAYDQAYQLAVEQNDPARAFEIAFSAATIERERNRHQEASRRYRSAALTSTDHPRAAEAHFLAIFHAGQAWSRRKDPQAFQSYLAMLDEHLRLWPQGTTADSVRWQYGRIAENQGEPEKAWNLYRAVSPDFPQFGDVVTAAGRAVTAYLRGLRTAGEPTDPVATEAVAWLAHLAETSPAVGADAARIAARLALDFLPDGPEQAESVLQPWLRRTDESEAGKRRAMRAMMVRVLAEQGRLDEALAMVGELGQGTPDVLLSTLAGLRSVVGDAAPEFRTRWAELQLQVVRQIEAQGAQLDARQRKELDFLHASALADSGRTPQALELFKKLSLAYPRDGSIQEAYAELLATRTDSVSLNQALTQWRQVENRAPRGSEQWFRAQYAVARLHLRLGNPQQTAKMVRLLQVLHPNLGGEPLRSRFLELLRQAER